MIESYCGISCSRCEHRAKINCVGCLRSGKPRWGDECPIKSCCESKALSHCGQCSVFPCDMALHFGEDLEIDPRSRLQNCCFWALEKRALTMIGHKEVVAFAFLQDYGVPTVCPLPKLHSEGYQKIYMAASVSAHEIDVFRRCNKAAVAVFEEMDSVTLEGSVEVWTDNYTKSSYWREELIEHFRGGADDPDYCVIEFTAEKAFFYFDGSKVISQVLR